MAYLPYDQEQDKDQQQDDKQSAGPVLGAPSAAPIQGGSGGQAKNASDGAGAAKPTHSGSYTNLMSYVNANAGNDAAMGQAVRGNVQHAASEADNSGKTWQESAAKQVNDNTVRDTDGTTAKVTNLAAPATTVNGMTDSTAKEGLRSYISSVAPIDPNDFSRLYNADYTGPKTAQDVQGYDDVGSAYSKVDNYGKRAAGDSSDRGSLLSDVYGQGGQQYGSGERRLDSFILGAGQQGQQALQGIAKDYGNYSGNWDGIKQAVGNDIQAGQDTTAATRQAIRDAATGAESTFDKQFAGLTDDAKTKTTASDALYKSIALGNNDPLIQAGYSPEEAQFLREIGVKPDDLVYRGKGYGLGDLASDDSKKNYSQLLDLLSGAGDPHAAKYDVNASRGATSTSVRAPDPELMKRLPDAMHIVSNARAGVDSYNKNVADPAARAIANGETILNPPHRMTVPEYMRTHGDWNGFAAILADLGIDPSTFQ